MNQAQLEAFWDSQPYKIYVVHLSHPRGKKPKDTKYVRVNAQRNDPSARRRAARVAAANSLAYSGAKTLDYWARLAHPVADLGCVPTQGAAQ